MAWLLAWSAALICSPVARSQGTLSVTSIAPPDGATDVALAVSIQVVFAAPVNPGTLNTASFYVQTCGESHLPGDISLSEDRRTATFVPAGALSLRTRYFVTLTSAITDDKAHPLAAQTTSFLTTADPQQAVSSASSVGTTVAGSIAGGTQAGENMGRSVAVVGDVNGDGFNDFLVGAPNADVSSVDSGSAYLIFGALGLQYGAGGERVTFVGESPFDQAGFSVALAGDQNGDGTPDLLIGAPGNDGDGTGAGRVYVVFGGPNLEPGTMNRPGNPGDRMS